MATSSFLSSSYQQKAEEPAPQGWRSHRPGDNDQKAALSIGPNSGYAMKLVETKKKTIVRSSAEHWHDVKPVLSEIAMAVAQQHGGAPTISDVEKAIALCEYDTQLQGPDLRERQLRMCDAGHDVHVRAHAVRYYIALNEETK